MKNLLLLLLAFCLFSCSPKTQLQSTVVPLDSLQLTPEAAAELAKFDIKLTPLNDKYVLLTQPSSKQGKTKYKNVGNTELKQKDVGNVAIGKKAGQQQDVGNTVVKDVGNVEQKSQSYWWVCLIVIALFIVWLQRFNA